MLYSAVRFSGKSNLRDFEVEAHSPLEARKKYRLQGRGCIFSRSPIVQSWLSGRFRRGAHGSAGNLVLKFRGPHLWRLGSAHLRTKRSGSGSRGDSRERKPSPARWQCDSGDERVPARSARGTARRHWWPDLSSQSEVKLAGQSRWSPHWPVLPRLTVPRRGCTAIPAAFR